MAAEAGDETSAACYLQGLAAGEGVLAELSGDIEERGGGVVGDESAFRFRTCGDDPLARLRSGDSAW